MNTKARKYIPLTEATYYILLSLVKPMHGYGIMQLVEEMTNGEVKAQSWNFIREYDEVTKREVNS